MELVICQLQTNELWLVIRWLITVIFGLLSFIGSFFIISMWKTMNRVDKRQAVMEPQLTGLIKDVEEIKSINVEFELLKQTVNKCKTCNP